MVDIYTDIKQVNGAWGHQETCLGTGGTTLRPCFITKSDPKINVFYIFYDILRDKSLIYAINGIVLKQNTWFCLTPTAF
jgi:hypothetical protein